MRSFTILAILTTFLVGGTTAFAPLSHTKPTAVTTLPHTSPFSTTTTTSPTTPTIRPTGTKLHSLFGLGGPELAIILVAAAFVLGPQKLAELGKDAGKIAGELKEVPKEFQKGLEEGEKEALVTKGKIMAEVEGGAKDADVTD